MLICMSTQAIAPDQPHSKLLRKPAVLARVGLSDTTVWRLEKAGKFPASIRISAGAVAWKESAIEAWIGEREAEAKRAAEAGR